VVSLDLSDSSATDVGVAAVAVCRRLQKIDLNTVKGTRTNVTYQGQCALCKFCSKILIVIPGRGVANAHTKFNQGVRESQYLRISKRISVLFY